MAARRTRAEAMAPIAAAVRQATAPSASAARGLRYCATVPTIGPPRGVLPRKAIAHRAITRPR